ncbi:hypothetical protein PYW07_005081 [Mythimna separata]|uniref:Uncharacterized protein n=1 Tax=Mythimna separata TaxID=271217 RepID=A0AAD8DPL9_MYTSE|nr:hypothetical protein PYW07_005081 [Mythimna separata]
MSAPTLKRSFQNPKITMSKIALILLLAIVPCFCQRPFYAGKRPIGFPDTPEATALSSKYEKLEIPAQLNGDTDYAKKLEALPQENQPFYYLNKEQIAANIANPKTYPFRPSVFNEKT